MKKHTFVGKLIHYERLNCSLYGNPKFLGWFQSEDGAELSGRTATNAACAYAFLNDIDLPREITYHITRTGTRIIDYIKIIK